MLEQNFGLTSAIRTMEVGIEALRTHFGDLLNLSIGYIVEESAKVGPRVQSLQLFLVQVQLLVHTSLVLQLKQNNNNIFVLFDLIGR